LSDPGARIAAAGRGTGTVTLAITGEVDTANAEGLERDALGHLDGAGHATVDLTGVSYLDSAGLRVLLNLWRHLEDTGGTLTVVVPADGFVAELLTVTGLRDRLSVVQPDG